MQGIEAGGPIGRARDGAAGERGPMAQHLAEGNDHAQNGKCILCRDGESGDSQWTKVGNR